MINATIEPAHNTTFNGQIKANIYARASCNIYPTLHGWHIIKCNNDSDEVDATITDQSTKRHHRYANRGWPTALENPHG